VDDFVANFNERRATHFSPADTICVDESMSRNPNGTAAQKYLQKDFYSMLAEELIDNPYDTCGG
jgi:hypothetical protein